jgi:hypothetical protein
MLVAITKKTAKFAAHFVFIGGTFLQEHIEARRMIWFYDTRISERSEVHFRRGVEYGQRRNDEIRTKARRHLFLGSDLVDQWRKPRVAFVQFSVRDLLTEGNGMREVGQLSMISEMVELDMSFGGKSIPEDHPDRLEQAFERVVQRASAVVRASVRNIDDPKTQSSILRRSSSSFKS